MLLFRQGACEVQMALPESSWTIDSDVKGALLRAGIIGFDDEAGRA